MRNEGRSLIIVFFYVIVMLMLCLFTVNTIKRNTNEVVPSPTEETSQKFGSSTVYIPVYIGTVPSESSTSDTSEPSEEMSFIVKSYKGKIGIFSNNGDLIQIIDVYTKTLPIADREMLEEGIEIKNIDELYDIIEDYTA